MSTKKTGYRPGLFRSVYPGAWVDNILGGRNTTLLNLSIEAFATQMVTATQELHHLFTPGEWKVLGSIVPERPNTRDKTPGLTLAGLLTERHELGEVARDYTESKVQHLSVMLSQLSYSQAWALILAVLWHRKHPGTQEWWTLAARQE